MAELDFCRIPLPLTRMPSFALEVRALLSAAPALRSFVLCESLLLLAQSGVAVVLPWWLATRGGATALAAYGVALALSTIVFVPLAAPFGDRQCKGLQMSRGLVALIAGLAACAGVAATDAFHLPWVIALAVHAACAESLLASARATIVPELVTPAQLPAAIRLQKLVHSTSAIAGPAVAGIGLAWAGVPASLSLFAVLCGLAWLFSLGIPRQATGAASAVGGTRRWWQDFRDGAAAKWNMPMERGWTLVNFVVWIFQGPAVGMLIAIKVHALGLSAQWLGTGVAALSLGTLLGSLFGSRMLVERLGRYKVRLGLGCLEGVCLAAAGLSSSAVLLCACLLLAGFCNASMALVGATHRALAIPRDYRARLLAASTVSTQIAGAIGASLVGAALARWNITQVYTAFGVLMATSVMGFLLVPRMKEFLGLDHERVVDWYAQQYPRVFRRAERAEAPR